MKKKYDTDETLWERIWDKVPYAHRIERWFDDKRLAIKSCYQRLTKGYADEETWSLDFSLSKWILPRLKHFRNNLNGVPPNMEKYPADMCYTGHCVTPEDVEKEKPEDRYNLTLDEWKDRLDKMIYAFEFILTEDEINEKCYPADYKWGFKRDGNKLVWDDDRKPDYTYYKECEEKHKDGLRLFCCYFRHLWD
jgi:hypothetical protein